uniref:Electron transfer flavoprotein subunit alpha/FixB family protein n=1 Tax=Thermorudis peleae TaxID=1382356 RepID=A0A831X7Y7_9BACT
MSQARVLVVVETVAGEARPAALELFGAGRPLADRLGGDLVALVAGSGVQAVAGLAGTLGADRILVADDPALAEPVVARVARAVETALAAADPELVLLPATTLGRDLAPLLAGRFRAAHLVNCTRIQLEDQAVVATRPVYQDKLLTTVRAPRGRRIFITARSGAFPVPEPQPGRQVSIEPLAVSFTEADQAVTVTRLVEKPKGQTNLESAPVVVVGGRGVGSAENFRLVEELAAAIDGAVGCTRAVSDLGWRPHYEQIGQTGKNVRPKLYLGVGVSGAVQHTVGMRGSDTIVVINRDPNAPLVKMADFAIIGDLFDIVPRLTKRLREVRGKA